MGRFHFAALSIPADRVDAGIGAGHFYMAMSLPCLCFETFLPGCLAAGERRVVGVAKMDRIDGMDLGGEE